MKFWENSFSTQITWYRQCQQSPSISRELISLHSYNIVIQPLAKATSTSSHLSIWQNHKAALSHFPAYLKSSGEQLFITAIYIAMFNSIYLLSPIAFCFHTESMQAHFATWKYLGFSKEYSTFPRVVFYFLSKYASSCFMAAVKVCIISLSFTKHPEKLFSK